MKPSRLATLAVALIIAGGLTGCLRRTIFDDTYERHLSGDKVFVGECLPDFTVTDLEGNTHTGKEYRENGKGTVVVLFDATCGDCAVAMPVLSGISEALPREDVEFIGISRGNNRRDVAAYTNGLQIAFPMCPVEDRSVYELFCKIYVPRVYVADRKGIVQAIYIEKIPEGDELEKTIREIVK